ncbi:hypothetical protein L5515_013525 [Caenorhabditis briggsae]|uniref:Uncharacterized protein n=1 Tax=Caenorhabditis briggsae TaxID=6238 RepID=A0AAE9EBS0_CAEBR|nr:hypothetical protein L5515_013525 [Caenorhabditis briggsae]
MNTLQPSTNLSIRGEFPSNFSHENALNFKSIYYEDANWVTLDMLKLIKTDNVIRKIQLDSNAEIDEYILFAGITVEQASDPNCYLIRLCQSETIQF